MLILHSIERSRDGRRLDYRYEARGPARRFFEGCQPFFAEYEDELEDCPDAIASVPFLANMLPIGWFGGFDVQVHPEVDAAFAAAQANLFEIYRDMYPHHRLRPSLRAFRTASVSWSGSRDLLLFSGGVDSVAAAIDLAAVKIEPVMVRGGDIPGGDARAWKFRSRILREHPVLGGLRRHVVRSNLREFYTPLVQSLCLGWWGHVQHGPAGIGLLAPLAWARGAARIHLSSSTMRPWGSSKEGDESVRYGSAGGASADAGIPRATKFRRIVDWAAARGATDLPLSVCVHQGPNCGCCDKCLSTLVLAVSIGVDPRRLGIPMDEDTYPGIFRSLAERSPTPLLLALWPPLRAAAADGLASGEFFVLSDRARERGFLERIADGELDRILGRWRFPFDRAGEQAFQYRWPRVYRGLSHLRRTLVGARSSS